MSKIKLITLFLGISLSAQTQSKIIFSRSPGGLNTGETPDLLLYNVASGKTSLLHKGSVKRRGEYSVSVSPDNSKLIVNTYKFGGWKLGIADFTDQGLSNFRKFTDRRNYEYNARWSYGGTLVVYEEYNWGTNDTELFIADDRGRSIAQFTFSKSDDQMASWTSDDRAVVFVSDRSGNYDIYMKSVEGEEIQNLTNHSATDFAPSTSKVHNKITFLSNRTGFINLYVMDYSGDNLVNLTPDLKSAIEFKGFHSTGFWSYQTSWSPDGKQIVFNTIMGSDLELFIINADGNNLKQVTSNHDSDFCPNWVD